MTSIQQSTRRYETWLREQLEGNLVKQDLARKHGKMKESAFSFLRAAYWRWAETILDVCPELADAKAVLGVGDIHFENYGTWRDVDGRLAWGVNDYDESAVMPFTLDLVRLSTSALLGRGRHPISESEIAGAILKGYRQGLNAPAPIVLDRDRRWLRDLLVVSDKARSKFWEKIASMRSNAAPPAFLAALDAGMPESKLTIKTSRRTAGTGSLGRPRWVGVANWRGAPVVREAKSLVGSAWTLAHKGTHRQTSYDDVAAGQYRPIDPWHSVRGNIVVRRLSPNNRKLEVDDGSAVFSADVLQAMGFDLANVHLGTASVDELKRELSRRKRGWLVQSSTRAAEAVTQDFKQWKV
jgi:uncharacterized protein (DUF2252 family)